MIAPSRFQDVRAAVRTYFSQQTQPNVRRYSPNLQLVESIARNRRQLLTTITEPKTVLSTRNLVFKPVGDGCNLKCSYCPTRGFDVSAVPDKEALHLILTNALESAESVIDVTIHGGEPLLLGKKRMRELLAILGDIRLTSRKLGSTRLQTNGVLLDDEWASIFKEYAVAVGVSLDATRAIHDEHRVDHQGRGSYDSVVAGLQALRRNSVFAPILMVLPDEPQYWPQVMAFIESGTYDSIDLELKYAKDGVSHPREYGRHVGELFARWVHGELPTSFSPSLFRSILDKITLDGGSLCWVTGTCERHLGVNQTGLVTPCCDRLTGSPKYELGSLKTQTLAEISSSKRATIFFNRANAMHPDCQTCEYRAVCNGGCVYYRIGATGEPDGKDPLCDVYKEMFGVIANILMSILHFKIQPADSGKPQDRDVDRCQPERVPPLFRILPS